MVRATAIPANLNLDLTCSSCRHSVASVLATELVSRLGPRTDSVARLISFCPRSECRAVLFVEYDLVNSRVRRVFPYPSESASDVHSAIPEPIREDVAEARRCLHAEAFRGVVVMCRRIMQHIAENQGAQGQDLRAQIDSLLAQGKITKSLHDAAHALRFFGNYGAHPRDDGLDRISSDEARTAFRLAEAFLVDLYVRPHETAELTSKSRKP